MSRAGLRILGGELRGRRLEVAGPVRPTESRVREALASIWRQPLAGCRFLDLFAGSGSVGLEAVSRGAERAWFVDSDPRVLKALRRNCEALAPEATRIVRRRLPDPKGRDLGERFELIFADPPYAFRDYAGLLRSAAGWLEPGGEMAIEHSVRARSGVPEVAAVAPWVGVDRRCYGESCLSFFRRVEDGRAGGIRRRVLG